MFASLLLRFITTEKVWLWSVRLTFYFQKYHRKAFEAEKAEIKRELAENEDERRKYTEKFEDLKDKVDSKIGSYQQQFNILLNSGQALKDVSNTEKAIKVYGYASKILRPFSRDRQVL